MRNPPFRFLFVLLLALTFASLAHAEDIYQAAQANDLATVKRLIEANPKLLEARNSEQETPLHRAARYGDREMVAYLISKGADVNARCYNRFTPLHLTTDPAIARLLIEKGADLKASSAGGTPLQKAAFDKNLAIIEVLLNAGEKLSFESLVQLNRTKDVVSMLKEQPWLAKPPRDCLTTAVNNGNLELVNRLLEYGADPNFSDNVNLSMPCTALSWAVMRSDYEMSERLFADGARADVGAYIGNGECSLLHCTIVDNDIRFTKLVLEHGAPVNTWSTMFRLTPLDVAVEKNDLERVKLLLQYGAHLNADSGDGATPLFVGAVKGYRELCRFLLSKGAVLDFYSACALGEKAAVERMLKQDSTLAITPDKRLKRQPIFYAVLGGNRAIVELLLRHHADPNARGPGYDDELSVYGTDDKGQKNIGDTPLIVAAGTSTVEIVRLLLDSGADVQAANTQHDTALHQAAKAGNLPIIKLLIEHASSRIIVGKG